MIKETITYEDFNGVERTEDFFFNLTSAELTALELAVKGGFSALLEGIIKSDNGPAVYKQLRYIISKAYGVKSEDGRRFDKNPRHFEDFETTEAYSTLIEGLISNPDKLNAFIEGIMPQKLMRQATEALDKFETREEAVEYLRSQSEKNYQG